MDYRGQDQEKGEAMTLFSDLDGTLVYSRRYRLRGPSVTAERIGG